MMGVSGENLRTLGHLGSVAQSRLDQDLFIEQCCQLWSELAGIGPNLDFFFWKICPKKV